MSSRCRTGAADGAAGEEIEEGLQRYTSSRLRHGLRGARPGGPSARRTGRSPGHPLGCAPRIPRSRRFALFVRSRAARNLADFIARVLATGRDEQAERRPWSRACHGRRHSAPGAPHRLGAHRGNLGVLAPSTTSLAPGRRPGRRCARRAPQGRLPRGALARAAQPARPHPQRLAVLSAAGRRRDGARARHHRSAGRAHDPPRRRPARRDAASPGQGPAAAQRLELGDLVRATIEDQRARFEARAASRSRQRPGRPLGRRGRRAPRAGDRQPLGNAVKFTPRAAASRSSVAPRGGPGRRCAFATRRRASSRRCSPALFEPFIQATAALDRSRGGLGLGPRAGQGARRAARRHRARRSARAGQRLRVHGPACRSRTRPRPTAAPRPRRRRRRAAACSSSRTTSTSAESLQRDARVDGHEVAVAARRPRRVVEAPRLPSRGHALRHRPARHGRLRGGPRASRRRRARAARYLVALTGYARPRIASAPPRRASTGTSPNLPPPRNWNVPSSSVPGPAWTAAR